MRLVQKSGREGRRQFVDDKKVNVKGYSRRAPSGRNNESKVSNPQDQGQEGSGVTILSSKGGGPQGVERLSRRESGQLQTEVEIHVGDPRNERGTKEYRRVI